MECPSGRLMMATALAALTVGATRSDAAETVALSRLDLSKMTAGWGEPVANRSCTGKPLSIGGRTFEQGVGTHAGSIMHVKLDGRAERFTALVGVDDATGGKGSVRFRVIADGATLFNSGTMQGGQPAKQVELPLAGVEHVILLVDTAGDDNRFDHANWAVAEFVYGGDPPVAMERPDANEPKVILTPKPAPAPRINGPRLFGVRPGRPFLYRVPCTGERPMTFSVEGLPATMSVDAATGIITGEAPKERGEQVVTFHARNEHGEAQKQFTIVVGDRLALTPPMGWNSWYIHYDRVTEEHMRHAADAMIDSGMADCGYMYVNIDDCWMKQRRNPPYRDAEGAMLPNAKFPDIKGMVDYIHAKGLRAGLYTSPGPWTCARYTGSYEHEEVDARKYVDWGFDFLKYDWCTYSRVSGKRTLPVSKKPYQKMGDILKTLDRDIVMNLCQYGWGDVWKWGGEVGGQCWRTTGDLGLERGGQMPGFFQIGLSNAQHWEYAKPGCWNDPDYILIGWVGAARGMREGEPTSLTANEQYSYMSMWCLMAAPLIFSGDVEKLDEFTVNVLCNPEVIAIDQDALGRQARVLRHSDDELVMVKPLEDGSLAVGLFNLREFEAKMSVAWKELGLEGARVARDLWRQKDLGSFKDRYEASVPRHGVSLIRLRAADNASQ